MDVQRAIHQLASVTKVDTSYLQHKLLNKPYVLVLPLAGLFVSAIEYSTPRPKITGMGSLNKLAELVLHAQFNDNLLNRMVVAPEMLCVPGVTVKTARSRLKELVMDEATMYIATPRLDITVNILPSDFKNGYMMLKTYAHPRVQVNRSFLKTSSQALF